MVPPNGRGHRRLRLLLFAFLPLGACGTWTAVSTDYRSDGTIALRCQSSLPHCLERAEDACHGTRYEVLSASDEHDYLGPGGGGQFETRSSRAIVRCGARGWPLFGTAAKDKDKPGAPPPPAGPPSPARACVPGATQTCVGAGACRGGQACLADGSGFGACVCATAPAAADAGTDTP